MRTANIIHIATHGLSPDVDVSPSTGYIPGALVFAKQAPDNIFDEVSECLLFPEEIHSIDLSHCELVVLTCCYAGSGQLNARSDEGLLGIGRALLYAGVKAAVLSLWPVPDTDATLKFMKYFYQSYTSSRKAAPALQFAQTQTILDGYAEENWAAYYVFGKGN